MIKTASTNFKSVHAVSVETIKSPKLTMTRTEHTPQWPFTTIFEPWSQFLLQIDRFSKERVSLLRYWLPLYKIVTDLLTRRIINAGICFSYYYENLWPKTNWKIWSAEIVNEMISCELKTSKNYLRIQFKRIRKGTIYIYNIVRWNTVHRQLRKDSSIN